jgi:formate-dependent nitrite reductase membrane component NrfD
MDGNILYNIPHQWGLQVYIAWYFLLTGLSAGSFVISAFAYLLGRKDLKPLGLIGAYLAPILLIGAPILLIIDAGKPLRFWYLLVTLNPTSPISWGSWLLTIYPIFSLIYLWHIRKGNEKMIKVLGITGIPLAISVHGYTGFALALAKLTPLWNNAIMPILFLISAMVSGIGMVMLVAVILNKMSIPISRLAGVGAAEMAAASDSQPLHEMLNKAGKFLAGFIVFDLFLIFSEVLVWLTESPEAHELAMNVLTGSFSFLFLGVEVILGAIIPLFLLLYPKTSRTVGGQALASALVVVGVVAMRYIVIIGGQGVPFN